MSLGFVTKGGFGTELVSSFDYYGVNMLIFSVGMIAITATNAFMEERVKRGNFRIVYAPISKEEIYLLKFCPPIYYRQSVIVFWFSAANIY